jgi:5-methyltetrahydrofolate corrinoid/iron sulfur protein methyltransferase
MIFIGERINGLQPRIYKFLQERDKEAIQRLARKQAEAGAAYLDLNVGTAWLRPAEVMAWLVKTVQEAVDIPLSLDSRRLEVIEAGLKACRTAALINATTGEKDKLSQFMELAAKYGAALVGLTMDEQGIPLHAVGRVAIAMRILDYGESHGIPRERLYIDPVVLPLKFSQSQGPVILEAIRQVAKERTPPHILVGLSNVSQGAKERKLINRTFLTMAITCGLDAVIADVLDEPLVEAARTADVIAERRLYSDQFLREGKKEVA